MASSIVLILRSVPFETPPAAAPQDKLTRLAIRDAAWRRLLMVRVRTIELQAGLKQS